MEVGFLFLLVIVFALLWYALEELFDYIERRKSA